MLEPAPKGEGSWTKCSNQTYHFELSISDREITEDIIKSWGAEIGAYKQVTINGQKAWMVNTSVGKGNTTIYFNYNGKSIAFVSTEALYSDIENTQTTSQIEKILSTLVINL